MVGTVLAQGKRLLARKVVEMAFLLSPVMLGASQTQGREFLVPPAVPGRDLELRLDAGSD
jgi:hypothetical protein